MVSSETWQVWPQPASDCVGIRNISSSERRHAEGAVAFSVRVKSICEVQNALTQGFISSLAARLTGRNQFQALGLRNRLRPRHLSQGNRSLVKPRNRRSRQPVLPTHKSWFCKKLEDHFLRYLGNSHADSPLDITERVIFHIQKSRDPRFVGEMQPEAGGRR